MVQETQPQDSSQIFEQEFQRQQKMKISKLTQSTPKLIVHGINDTMQLTELMQLGQNFKIKNFDIARMNNEGIITLIFAVYQEAQEFGHFLENEKRCELFNTAGTADTTNGPADNRIG